MICYAAVHKFLSRSAGVIVVVAGLSGLAEGRADTTATELPEQDMPDLEMPQEAPQAEPGRGTDPVDFSASDSLIFNLKPEREVRLYGNARVEHPQGELTAGKVTLNLDQNLMSAFTDVEDDTLAEPVLQRGADRIRSRRIQYNYVTDKGKFDVARVTIDKGNLIGTHVKRTAPHVVFVEDGIYSTCELDHPHFYIRANKMKVVDEDEVFFTNARLFILDIPYPLVFPFGYVPSRIQRTQSGLLEPTFAYQDAHNRGLGLQNMGWFQYFNDYLAGQASFDIFTSGSYYVDSRLNYARRDHYNGSIALGYSFVRGLESTDPFFSSNTQRSLQINHSQTISPYAWLSANINLRTANFYEQNSARIDDRAEVKTSSTMSYNFRHPENTYTLSVTGKQDRNFQTDVTSLSGPDVDFSTQRFTPFTRTRGIGEERWYETFNVQYRSRFRSRFNFNPLNDEVDITFLEALFNPSLHRQATGSLRHFDYGLHHTASAGTSLLNSQFVNLSANLNLNEYWYPQTIRREYDPETETVEDRLERGFAAARDFNTSASLGTTLYGIWNQRIGALQGFRHTFRPSVSFTYSPDFSDEFWGTYREVQVDEEGNTQTYPIFQGSIIGGPGAGKQQSIGLNLRNTLETKHVRRDTTGEVRENVIRIIESLNASVSYNFAAEQFNLSDLSTSASSSIFPNINLNANATFSFYDTDDDGRRIDRYIWQDSNRFARMTRFAVRATTNLSGGQGGPRINPGEPYFPERYDPYDQSIFHPMDDGFNNSQTAPMQVPWSVNINFNYTWQRTATGDIRRQAAINANNLRMRVTPEWQVETSLGYDFIQQEQTPTRFRVTRNLHCWDLSFEWSPFGDFQYYMFRLTVRDSQIQSLFQKLPGLNNLERTSNPAARRSSAF